MDRYVEDAVDGMEGKCTGRRIEPAITVENKAISRKTADHLGRTGSPEREAPNVNGDGFYFDWSR